MSTFHRGAKLCALAASVILVATACSSSGGGSSSNTGGPTGGNNGGSTSGSNATSTAGTPQRGGDLTVLEGASFSGAWPSGLDPATNTTGGANITQQQAIFGGLFLLRADNDGKNAKIVPYQAQSGKLSPDAKTLTIKLKPGIKFSDGTPMNAKAVIWNFERDSKSPCTCAPTWDIRKTDPFTSPDPLTVVVHFTKPNAAILNGFPASNVNWIASPTAYKKMGAAKFKIKPVGAGPFTVVTNDLSSKLVVKRNPNFFVKGQPYLDKLTFQPIGGDQPAYQALLAGQGDAYEGMSTWPVIQQAQKNPKLQVTLQPGTSPYVVQVNTQIPPFNNIKAREALYYATDWNAIAKGIFGGKVNVVQGFTTPADLFYHRKTPGYRTFDLAKAKALVKELGGLSVKLETLSAYTADAVNKALQTQWEKAGIKVNIKSEQLNGVIKSFNGGKWQAFLQTAGAWDPASGVGVGFRFKSNSPFTGVKDKHLDALFDKAVSTSDMAQRDKTYQEIAKYISDKAYGEFGFAFAPANLAVKGVHGPGLTTGIPALVVNTGIIWSEVWKDQS